MSSPQSTSAKAKLCQLFELFPLDFESNPSDSDITLITECVKTYKDSADQQTSFSFNFLEGREIKLIIDFFSRYGSQIKNLEIEDCPVKLQNKYCLCFLGPLIQTDYELLERTLEILEKGGTSNPSSVCVIRERELKILSLFVAKYAPTIQQPNTNLQ